MGLPEEKIQPEASFVKDFDFEEFQLGYLVFYLESYFRITIRESEYHKLDTIGSSMDFIRKELRKRERLKLMRRKNRPSETIKFVPMIVFQPTNKSLVCPHLLYRPRTTAFSSANRCITRV
jgi:acyl carrier protein